MKPNLWPSLGYQDAAAAVRFLIQGLGFDELAHHAGTQPGRINQAVLHWQDGGLITVHSAEPDTRQLRQPRRPLSDRNLPRHGQSGRSVSPCHHGSFGWTTR